MVGAQGVSMADMLTDAEWTRIEEFVNTPPYEREPEMLIPDDD
jgi:hypothetical protein